MARLSLLLAAIASSALAQQQSAPPAGGGPLSRSDIAALAHVQVAINVAHDSNNVQRAKPGNKKEENQMQLMENLRLQIAQILQSHGLTDAEYSRRTYLVMVDTGARRVFDSVVVSLTGGPLPGQLAGATRLSVPAGPVGVHIGHVVNGFSEAPALMGLLPAAMAEARIAAQHATLASRQPTNLAYMQTHAGHVIHALDPSLIAAGPGLGYGVKKAASGVAQHIEMAAATPGATPAITVHAVHIATCARNTITRADQLVALARQVLAATDPAAAATLVNQMMSLADQLIEGADANNDGRITWEQGEGGLRHADEHVKLMLGVR